MSWQHDVTSQYDMSSRHEVSSQPTSLDWSLALMTVMLIGAAVALMILV